MPLATVTNTFSDVGVSSGLPLQKGQAFTYAVDYSVDFDGQLILEYTENGGGSYVNIWTSVVGTITDISATAISNVKAGLYRFRCVLGSEATITGTAAITLTEVTTGIEEVVNNKGETLFRIDQDSVGLVKRYSQKRLINTGAKAGTTAGWVVNAGDDLGLLATVPQSQTASTLVIPISGLKVGDTITGFHLVGQIDSAGNTVTLDADLRSLTAAAAGHTDASVGAITQVSVTADTALSSANTEKASLTQAVGATTTFYVLVTATTGATCDIEIQGVAVTVTEA